MRRVYNVPFFLILLGILILPGRVAASDQAKEQRWAEQIVDSLLVGEPATLQAGDLEFLAIYAEAAEGTGDRAVILMHGMGAHPNWPEVIQPLRSELPDHGWATLSLQMPILPNEAELSDYLPLLDEAPARIQAGIDFLKAQGMNTIVLAGHSLGSAMGCSFLVKPGSRDVQAFIGIGMQPSRLDPRLDSATCLEALQVPVLDLYGTRDDRARDSATARKRAAQKAGNQAYRPRAVEGADHFFTGLQSELVRTVWGWLDRQFPEQPAP